MPPDALRDRMLLASAVLFATAIAASELAVPNDLFWHLAIAREISHHGFPYVDPFAFSTSQIAWSPPEWLGEIAFAVAYVSIGFAGTTLLTLLAIAGCFAAIARAARSVVTAPAAALALLALAWPAAVHLPMRPLVLGDLCFAVLIARLYALRAGDARGLSWTPLLFALWANLHPSWPMGLAVLWLHALVLGPLRSPLARLGLVVETLPVPAQRALAIAALASPLAVLARPDGIDGALYPFVHVIGLGDRMREIIEWFAPDFGEPINLAWLVLLALTLVLMLADKTRVHALDLALVLLGAAMAMRYQRFLPLAAFLATPALARGLGRTRLATFALSRGTSRLMLGCALLLLVFGIPSSRDLATDVHERYPYAAVRWAAGHHVGAVRAFNTFEDGGYLLFYRSGRPVFIDSRFDLYARAGVFDDYLALRHGERVAEIVDHYAFDAAFVPTAERDENFAALEAALPGLMVGGMLGTSIVATIVAHHYRNVVERTMRVIGEPAATTWLPRFADPRILIDEGLRQTLFADLRPTGLDAQALVDAAREALVQSIHIGVMLTAIAALAAALLVRRISHITFRRAGTVAAPATAPAPAKQQG